MPAISFATIAFCVNVEDLNAYVKQGTFLYVDTENNEEHRVSAKVYTTSNGPYMETQKMYFMSGTVVYRPQTSMQLAPTTMAELSIPQSKLPAVGIQMHGTVTIGKPAALFNKLLEDMFAFPAKTECYDPGLGASSQKGSFLCEIVFTYDKEENHLKSIHFNEKNNTGLVKPETSGKVVDLRFEWREAVEGAEDDIATGRLIGFTYTKFRDSTINPTSAMSTTPTPSPSKRAPLGGNIRSIGSYDHKSSLSTTTLSKTSLSMPSKTTDEAKLAEPKDSAGEADVDTVATASRGKKRKDLSVLEDEIKDVEETETAASKRPRRH